MITIETNKGQLVVESIREGVEVRVKRSGKVVEDFEITTGSKSTRLAAGEYEIEIVGQTDGLSIQNGKFVLKRGDIVIAKVVEIPKGQAVAQHAHETEPETPQREPAKPVLVEIVDRQAKGMETFEATNPDVLAERKALEALKKNISVKFVDTPLTEAVQVLEEKTGFPFSLDKEGLNDASIPADTPVNLSFDNKPAAAVLDLFVRPIESAWYVEEGQVIITTAERYNQRMVMRIYPIGKLLPGVRLAIERIAAEPPPPAPPAGGGGGGGGFFAVGDAPQTLTPPLKSSTILHNFGGGQGAYVPTVLSHFEALLTDTINGPWQVVNGDGGTIELLQNMLIIYHTRRTHAEIESLLRIMEATFVQPLNTPLEIHLTEADNIVRKQLARVIDVDFKDLSLIEVTKQIGEQLGVSVKLDRDRLEDEGIAVDTPVTFNAKGLTGELLLSRMLKPLQLGSVVEQGQLVVTTAAIEHGRLSGKIYDVRHLLNRGLHPSRLTQAIESATPGPWMNNDGEGGSISLFADTLMIVRQTSRNHIDVAKFLASLTSQLSDQPEVPRAMKPQANATGPAVPTARKQPQRGGPVTEPPKPKNNNQPEYDGKSIEQWFAVLDTERSPTRLAEAFDALRFLAQKSHTEQIAERALRVFRNVDAESQFGSGKDTRQVSTITSGLLRSLPPTILVSACAKELNQGNERSRLFVLRHGMRSFLLSWLESNELVQALLQTSRDHDDLVREQSVSWLSILIYNFPKLPLVSEVNVRLRELLSDKATPVVLTACRGLFASKADGPAICDALSPLVIGNNEGQQNEALWLLAVMGPSAEKGVPALSSMLLSEGNPESHVGQWSQNSYVRTSGFFSTYSGRSGIGSRELISKELAIIALARIGKAASPALPTIQQALEKRQDQVSRGSLDVVGSIRDLLVATKARIEEQTIPNAERLAKNELTLDDFDQMESTYKTLRIENEMLFLDGRHGDFINKAGNKISILEIEVAIEDICRDLKYLVVPTPNEFYGEEVAVVFFEKFPDEKLQEEIQLFCLKNLGGLKVPKYFFHLPEMPMTSNGKVSRVQVASLLEKHRKEL